ncbi:MAG: MarR family transcriptional regulator [Acidobacteriota bacterium]|nr:MarR family transcriptional regulator [Acidobacteriota bacterium]
MGTCGEPQWLDGEEERAWLALVAVLCTLPAALDGQLQREAGLTLYEYLVLASLSDHPEQSLRMSDLAVLTNGSLPRLSQVVTKLERRGWVRRTPDPGDGRCTRCALTSEGCAKLEESAPGHVGAVRRLVFDPITRAQVHQVCAIHERIRTAVAPDGLQ